MFPGIVVQAEARRFLDEFGIAYTEYKEGFYVADSIESVCRTCASAIGAGAKVFNLMSVEDVIIREGGRVSGLIVTDLAINCGASLTDGGRVFVMRTSVDRGGAGVGRFGGRYMFCSRFCTGAG